MKITDEIMSKLVKIKNGKYKGCYKKGTSIYKIQESCKECGEKYLTNVYYLAKGKGLFCSHSCQSKGKNNSFYGKKHTKESKSKQGFNVSDNPSTIKYWLNKGYKRHEALQKLNKNNRINSIFCEEYWLNKGYTKEQAKYKISEKQIENGKKSRQNNSFIPTQIEYWLSKGYTDKQAKELLSERQSTFSLKKCIEKYGEKRGLKVWKERQKIWQNTLKSKSPEEIERINKAKMFKNSFSKISQDLFWKLYEKIKNDFKDIYFAQLGKRKGKDVSGNNNEYMILFKDRNIVFPDFFIKDVNKVIEFDGDYWHGEVRGNIEKDKQRDKLIIENGYDVFHVKERDYNNNPEKIKSMYGVYK